MSPKSKSRGNGQGTAVKRGSTWTARVVAGWKLAGDPPHKVPVYRTKGGFRRRTDALNYCPQLLAEQSRPAAAPPLRHYWEIYSAGELLSLSVSKQKSYAKAWQRCASLSLRPVDSITVSDLRALVSAQTSTYYTAHDMKILLGHLYDLAAADEWVNKDLPDYILLPDLNEKERQPFTDSEQAALWKLYESGYADAAIPLVMIYTGMMPGELQRLTASMIDWDARQINGVGLKTKVRRNASVYLPNSIVPVLQAAAAGKSGLLWGFPLREFYTRYYATLEAAGCRRLPPYCCRHTTATALAITENIAPQTIRKIMRWSTSRMLDRYAHPSDTDAIAAADTLQRKSY